MEGGEKGFPETPIGSPRSLGRKSKLRNCMRGGHQGKRTYWEEWRKVGDSWGSDQAWASGWGKTRVGEGDIRSNNGLEKGGRGRGGGDRGEDWGYGAYS